MAAAPLLLASPSAWARLSRRGARAVLLLLLLLAVAAVGIAGDAAPGDAARTRFALDTGLVEGVRHGGDYYGVAAELVRSDAVVARPLTGVRLPTLATIAAALPLPIVRILLATLALAVTLAWYERLVPAFARPATAIGAAVLLLAGVAAAFRPENALVPEAWAGLFVALSLARWRPGRPVEAVAWALAAALIDETAAAAMLAMAIVAAIRRDRREVAGWAVALALLALVVAAHRHAVAAAGIVFADVDVPAATGIGATLGDLRDASAAALLPLSAAAALPVLAIAGWSAWRDPVAVGIVAVTLALLAVAALSPVGSEAAMLVAPLSLAGLLFLPDGLRDLAAAALDRRRIVVRRVLR